MTTIRIDLDEHLEAFLLGLKWWRAPSSGIWHALVGDDLCCRTPRFADAKGARVRDSERAGLCCSKCSREIRRAFWASVERAAAFHDEQSSNDHRARGASGGDS